MLFEGYKMTATDAAEEMEEVQHDIRKREEEVSQANLFDFFVYCFAPDIYPNNNNFIAC